MIERTSGRRARATRHGFVALVLATAIFALVGGATAACAQTVHEVTIATPSMLAIEVRDPPFQPGRIEPLSIPSREEQGSWIKVGDEWGRVVGRDRTHVRISDKPPATFVNFTRLEDAGAYPAIGGNKVTSVFRKSVPYDSGIYRGADGETMTGASLKHFIYLQLAQPLGEGAYTIRWPAGTLPDMQFDYATQRTRAIAIHANQNGYRATDEGKIAYLSLWIPEGPAEGAVDFRTHGIKAFHIIDEAGNTHFSSEIALRAAPSDPEAGNGLRTPLLEYPSASQPAINVVRMDAGPPIMAHAPKHGFTTGQRIWLDGFSGPTKQFNGFATVGATTPDTFELTEQPSGNSAPSSVGPPTAVPVHQANRAGTFVFELNFGAWTPEVDGKFRIYVPGLGVSDTFEVRDDIWLRAGKTSVGGLYNHRSGIALDGRFGFTRPAPFRPGPQVTVLLSKIPLPWTSNSHAGFISADFGGKAPWITSEAAPATYWGGYMDAGDWDRRIDHIDVSYLLLDVYDSAPDVWRASPLGIPKSSEHLDRELYADIDDLPDILHEAIWTLDFFRRLQLPDGSVRGGIESSAHPLLGEPSFLEHLTIYAYAPDHISSYRYAGGAARLAGTLDRLGKTRLAEVYRKSALAAWQAAEKINTNQETYYAEAKSIAESSGAFASAPWDVRARRLEQDAFQHRTAAAAALFRLTGEDEYRTVFEAAWAGKMELHGYTADGAWEYLRATHASANKELQNRIAQMFVASAQSIAKAQDAVAYPSMKHPFAPIGWGQGLAPDYNQAQMFIRAHQISNDKNLLRTMQVASAQILGANQAGLSFTTGLGHRTVKHPLHEDHRAMGVRAPDGITIYGWAPQAETAHEWIYGPYWSPLPISGTKENAQYRRVAPNRFAMPFYEYLIEHPLLVMQQEYTVHQTIGTTAGMWLYLHANSVEKGRAPR
jgi:endoglucanase